MLKHPLVSVVMGYYNHGKYLPFCLNSIFNQGIKNIEVILVNDASTDNSLEIAKKFANKDKRIIVLENKQNRGCAKSTERAMKYARGKYISLTSADDGMLPGNLKEKIKLLEENPDVGFVFSEVRIISQNGEKIMDSNYRKKKSYIGREDYEDFIKYGTFIHTGTIVARKEVFKSVNYYNSKFSQAGEWYTQLKLVKNYKSAYLAKPLMFFRLHDSNLSNSFNLNRSEREFKEIINKLLNENPSKKVERFLLASFNYSMGRAYLDKKKYLKALKYFIISFLKNPACIKSHLIN